MQSLDYSKRISKFLAQFVAQVKLENGAGRFDINKSAEKFLQPILNKVFKTQFERTEFMKVNYPAVDLLSNDRKISIQVTSEKGFGKIKDTISGFISHKLFDKSTLFHLVIDEDYSTQKTDEEISNYIKEQLEANSIDPSVNIAFSSANIWNISTLIKEIERKCEVHELKEISDYLESEYGNISNQTFDFALIPYKSAFEQQLNPRSVNLPVQFINNFLGREMDFGELDAFIKSDEKVMAIVADGGYGKTRLCVEFFKAKIDPSEDVEAFVLNDQAFNGQQLRSGVNADKKLVVLLDDAHRKTDVLENLVTVANILPNVKILLTIRKAVYEETIKALPTHSRRLNAIQLDRLSYDDTLSLIQSQLPGLDEDQCKRLAEESKGVPTVILALCQMIREGKYSSEISEDDNFVSFVREIKNQVVSDIHATYFIDKQEVNKTIEMLSLLGPIKNNDEEIRAVAEINSISFEETSMILDYLEDYEFIRRRLVISILADPYADVLLLDMAPQIRFILAKNGIERFMDRVIRNLVEVEHSGKLRLNVDAIVSTFITSITSNPASSPDDLYRLKENLDTLAHFAFKKPALVSKALEIILDTTKDNKEFWTRDAGASWNFSRKREIHDQLDTIFSITVLNTHDEEVLLHLFNLMCEYAKRRANNDILSKAFRFRIYDFTEYRYRPTVPVERQQFLVKRLTEILAQPELSSFDIQIVIKGASSLLALTFDLEQRYDPYKYTLSYGHGNIPFNPVTNKIRTDTVNILVALYRRFRGSEAAQKIYDILLRQLFSLVKPNKGDPTFNQSEQTVLVVEFFLGTMTDGATVNERAKLAQQLTNLSRRGLKEEYKQLYDNLRTVAQKVQERCERLELLLKADYFFKKKNLVSELEKVVREYAQWDDFYKDVIKVRQNLSGTDLNCINDLVGFLNATHKDQSKILFEFVRTNHPEYAADFGELICANGNDPEYFYSNLNFIWSMGTEEAKAGVIWLLMGKYRDKTLHQQRDFAYFETVVRENNQEGIWRLVLFLNDYAFVNIDKTLQLGSQIIALENMRFEEQLIQTLFSDTKACEEFKHEFKKFAFEHTVPMPMNTHYYQHIFEFIDRHFGFDTLFEFVLVKVAYLEKEEAFYSLSFHDRHDFPEKSVTQKEQDFIKVVEWYLSVEKPSEFLHLKIVEFFRPSFAFTPSIKTKLEELISKRPADMEFAISVCKSLGVFETQNEELLSFLIAIANRITKMKGFTKRRLVDVFGLDLIYNGGFKSRNAERKKQLQSILETYELEKEVREIFEHALERVEDSIKRERNDEDSQW